MIKSAEIMAGVKRVKGIWDQQIDAHTQETAGAVLKILERLSNLLEKGRQTKIGKQIGNTLDRINLVMKGDEIAREYIREIENIITSEDLDTASAELCGLREIIECNSALTIGVIDILHRRIDRELERIEGAFSSLAVGTYLLRLEKVIEGENVEDDLYDLYDEVLRNIQLGVSDKDNLLFHINFHIQSRDVDDEE